MQICADIKNRTCHGGKAGAVLLSVSPYMRFFIEGKINDM